MQSSLVQRWKDMVASYANPLGLPTDPILTWIAIESGGNMSAPGMTTEAGIFQLDFPDDQVFGATLQGLLAIARQSDSFGPGHDFTDLSWMTPGQVDEEVGAGVRKVAGCRDLVRKSLAQAGQSWPEDSFDFGSMVKQVHAGGTATVAELVPLLRPHSWADFRSKVHSLDISQVQSPGIRLLMQWHSVYGLRNRLEDTLRNAEIVGRAWGKEMP